MDLLFAASEAVPFAKTGGLADVVGALPGALARRGHNVAVVLPLYPQCRGVDGELKHVDIPLRFIVGQGIARAGIRATELPSTGVQVFLIEHDQYFNRKGFYGEEGRDYEDNAERFVFFSRAVLELARLMDPVPEVIHCHDWFTGLVPMFLEECYRNEFPDMGTMLTIHNLSYQGCFDVLDFDVTGLPGFTMAPLAALEFHGQMNLLKGGLVYADLLTTVSPTYAEEIQTEQYGAGLAGVLNSRREDLHGVVNGIDTEIWNPRTDPLIPAHYDGDNWREGKATCKQALQRATGLPERSDVPLIGMVTRLVDQKGIDLFLSIAEELMTRNVQWVILGTGLSKYHDRLRDLATRYRDRLGLFLKFHNQLAHHIEAGADIFLMPSRYEPCGLNQLYSMRYGTVPVVRHTGGLADTVIDCSDDTLAHGTATGFQFVEPHPDALRGALQRAISAYHDTQMWPQLVEHGMRQDWSWDHSAAQYERLYEQIIERRVADDRAV